MKYYKTGDFAEQIGVTPVTLRKWEQSGKLIPHHRSPTGYRYYSEEQLKDYLDSKVATEKGGGVDVRS